jgi:signal transduction histidine kinase
MEGSCKALGCESARIAMREGDKWVIRYVSNMPDDLIERSFTDEELPHAALAMNTKKPVAIDDAFHDDRTNNEMMKSHGIRSVMVVPLMEKNVVTGTLLYGYHSRMASFTGPDMDYAIRMATGMTIALQNARQHQDIEESKRLSDALNEIDTVLYSAKDYEVIMNRMLQLATEAIGAETAVIFSKEGERWIVQYEYKLPVSLIGQSFSNTEVRHTAITAETKRTFVSQDVVNDPNIDQKFVEMLEIRSLLDFPLILKGEVIGDLTFHYHSSAVPFNEKQIEFARKLQFSISLALENGRLLETSKKSESNLKEAEKLGKFGYFNYDIPTRELNWSEGLFHIFGRDSALGEPTLEEFFEMFSVDPGLKAMAELLGNEETSEFDAAGKRDGLALVFHFVIRSVKDSKGDIMTRFGSIQDITERKRCEEAVQEANRELGAFNYTVAHDLRTPLTAINMCCQALMVTCSDKLDEQSKSYIKEAYEGTLRMDRIINALLNFSRLSHAEPKREPVNLCGICEEVASELKLSESERQVSFLIPEEIVANADPDLLRGVLSNLFGNAWKYTGHREDGVIEFGTTEVDGTRAYFVRDNGLGFDPAEADKLFAPFERLASGKEFGGIGIGLAIVDRIIRRHGGKVWAEGEPGKGATFYFTL